MKSIIELDPKIKIRNVSELINKPIISRVNKFDEDAVKKLSEDIEKASDTGQTIFPILLDSYGGQCYSLLSMVDILKNSKFKIATIVEGKAMSCGLDLFCCGDEGLRFAGPNATFMLHDVSNATYGKVEEIKADAKETDRLNEHIYKMMARNCGKPEDYFLKLIHEKGHAEYYMTPEEAKLHNIVNHIRIPNFTTKIYADILFE